MDTIVLSVVKSRTHSKFDTPEQHVVDIFINGRNLIDIVREVEQPFADKEGRPELAGQYEGLPAEAIFVPSRHLMGEPAEYVNDVPCEHENKIVLYRCAGCGVVGCWPLLVAITVGDDTITWSEFEQPHRDAGLLTQEERWWKYDFLGPFVFDRQQYEDALRGPRPLDPRPLTLDP